MLYYIYTIANFLGNHIQSCILIFAHCTLTKITYFVCLKSCVPQTNNLFKGQTHDNWDFRGIQATPFSEKAIQSLPWPILDTLHFFWPPSDVSWFLTMVITTINPIVIVAMCTN